MFKNLSVLCSALLGLCTWSLWKMEGTCSSQAFDLWMRMASALGMALILFLLYVLHGTSSLHYTLIYPCESWHLAQRHSFTQLLMCVLEVSKPLTIVQALLGFFLIGWNRDDQVSVCICVLYTCLLMDSRYAVCAPFGFCCFIQE